MDVKMTIISAYDAFSSHNNVKYISPDLFSVLFDVTLVKKNIVLVFLFFGVQQ